jgi:hypothetical protein
MSSKSPADAAWAGIADPMADADATTPIRRRIPARADGISDDTAVAAPTGRRGFDHETILHHLRGGPKGPPFSSAKKIMLNQRDEIMIRSNLIGT